MGLFGFLQNEIQGAGNAIENNFVRPVSSAFQGISNAISNGSVANSIHNFNQGTTNWQQAIQGNLNRNVGQPVSRLGSAIAQSIRPATVDTANFGKAIFSPVEGAINTVRSVPALAYGALGSVTPGHTFKGNIQQFNQAVPQASFADQGMQSLVNRGLVPARAGTLLNQGGQIAGGMTVPLPGIGKVAALEGLSPVSRLAAYTALRGGEGAAVGGLNALSQNGDVSQAIQGAKQGALFGAAGNVLLSPRLVGESLGQIHNMEPVPAKVSFTGIGPSSPPQQVEHNLSLRAKTSPDIPPAAQEQIPTMTHDVQARAPIIAQMDALAKSDPAAVQLIMMDPSHPASTAAGIALVKQHGLEGSNLQASGDITGANAAFDRMNQTMDIVNQNNLIHGRASDMNKALASISPAGRVSYAQHLIDNYNAANPNRPIAKLSAEETAALYTQAQDAQALPPGRDQNLAMQKVNEAIASKLPTPLGDKLFSLYRTGLLTGFRTPGKVVLTNATTLAAEQAKSPFAAGADILGSALTGQRSMVATPRGLVGGFSSGIQAAVDNFVHGYNAPGTGGHSAATVTGEMHQVNFGDTWYGTLAKNYVETIGRLHGSLYKPFWGAQHLNSLTDMALTNAANKGLSGTARETFVTDFVKQATEASVQGVKADKYAAFTTPQGAAQRAAYEADYTTNLNKTWLGNLTGGAARAGGNAQRVLTPFTQIPSALATKIVDYSLVGPLKEAFTSWEATGGIDQRAMSQAIGRAGVGTGVMALGYQLAKAGLVTGSYPTDAKTQAEWQLEGKMANSFLGTDGKYHQLASFGSTGNAVAAGAAFFQGMQGNRKTPGSIFNAGVGAAAQAGSVIADSPYLQTAANVTNALKTPGTYALKTVEGLASSVIPTGIQNAATASDPLQRQTNSIVDAITNKIPFLREGNLPKIDVTGQPVPRGNSPLGSLLDPTYASQARNTDFTNNLDALAATGNDVTPAKVDKTISALGVQHALTPQQQTELQTRVGQDVTTGMQALMNTAEYKALTNNADRQTALQSLESSIRAQDFVNYVKDNNLPVSGPLSVKAQATQDLIAAFRSGDSAKAQSVLAGIPVNSRSTVYSDAMKMLNNSPLSADQQLNQNIGSALGIGTSSASPSSNLRLTGKITAGKIAGGRKVSAGRGGKPKLLSNLRSRSLKSFKAPQAKLISISNGSTTLGRPKVPTIPRIPTSTFGPKLRAPSRGSVRRTVRRA